MRAPARVIPQAVAPPQQRLVHAAAVVAAAVVAQQGALAFFFSQDDFAGLARACGLLPRLAGPWRWISHQLFWDVMRSLAGLAPLAYHVASLAAHSAGAVLLLFWLRRRVSAAAALVGAVFLATHPALFTAVHWISAIGDPLALAFGVTALLFVERRDAWRWLAVPSFGAALLCKESAVTLPLVVLLAATTRTRREGDTAAGPMDAGRAADRDHGSALRTAVRDPLTLALFTAALGYVAYLATVDAMGSRHEGAGAAYALGLGAHVPGNALSYLGWTVNLAFLTVRGFSDARDPLVYGWALAALALALVALAWAPLRRRGFGAACLAYVALLLPVLPLRSHTYHYYLELPMLGAAWALALVFDTVVASGTAGFARGALAVARRGLPASLSWTLVLLLTANGMLLVRRCETAPLGIPSLLADPVIDRARIAQRVRDGIASAHPAPGTRLALWLPEGWAYPGAAPPTQGTPGVPYTRRNLRIALLDGLAVRVLFPEVAEARVVDRHEPLPASWSWALCRPDGQLRVLSTAELDSLLHRFGEPR